MMQLLVSPWADHFDQLIESASSSLVLCSPYLSYGACSRVRERLAARESGEPCEVYVLTDLSLDNMLSGVTDVTALLGLVQAMPAVTVRVLPSLHAKVYVADTARAAITSANLTEAGLSRNFEYGVLVDDAALVRRIREDVLQYGGLGSPVAPEQLRLLSDTTLELRDIRKRTERSLRSTLRREFNRRLRAAEDEVLRVRAAGRAPTTIFAEAILHVLRSGPKRTPDIHAAVKAIHPDLCDDTEYRVIDGRRFGRKWKHAVRTAQWHLKEQGRVTLEDDLWRLCDQPRVEQHGELGAQGTAPS